jgi:hypothetical protein
MDDRRENPSFDSFITQATSASDPAFIDVGSNGFCNMTQAEFAAFKLSPPRQASENIGPRHQ